MRGSGGFLGGVGGLLGIRRFLGGNPRFRGQPLRLTPLFAGDHSRTRRNLVLPGGIAFSVAMYNDFEAGSRPVPRRRTRVRAGPPAHRLEDGRKLGVIAAGIVDRPKAGRIEVAIERPGPQRLAFVGRARGRCLERGANPAARLLARRVAGAREHVGGGTRRGLDSITQPPRGGQEILSALCPRGGVPVSIPRIGSGHKQLGDQRWSAGSELVDRPHTHRRLAELADGERRIRIRGAKFARQRRSAGYEVLERAVVQAGGIHDPGV